MDFRNFTPFPNLRFFGETHDGSQFGVLLVKGTFSINPDGALSVAKEQARILQSDMPYGEHNVSALRYPSDLVPIKPACDLIMNAVARAPGGEARASWHCGIEITNSTTTVRKEFCVTGPREWQPIWRDRHGEHIRKPDGTHALFSGWRLTNSVPVASVPMRYELAFGGSIERVSQGSGDENSAGVEAYEYNPLGRGWAAEDANSATAPIPVPQIVTPNTEMLTPFQPLKVEGTGAMPPAWLPRRIKGGTYDDEWKSTVWPRWPADYDFGFHNSAHPDLILSGYPEPGTRIQHWGFDREDKISTLILPELELAVRILRDDGKVDDLPMNLDTVLIDIEDEDSDEHQVFLSWRVSFEPAAISGLAILGRVPDGAADEKMRAEVGEV